jgi:hypothetical protein
MAGIPFGFSNGRPPVAPKSDSPRWNQTKSDEGGRRREKAAVNAPLVLRSTTAEGGHANHVNAAQIRLVAGAGLISAKVVKVDAANDLTLLKADGSRRRWCRQS